VKEKREGIKGTIDQFSPRSSTNRVLKGRTNRGKGGQTTRGKGAIIDSVHREDSEKSPSVISLRGGGARRAR